MLVIETLVCACVFLIQLIVRKNSLAHHSYVSGVFRIVRPGWFSVEVSTQRLHRRTGVLQTGTSRYLLLSCTAVNFRCVALNWCFFNRCIALTDKSSLHLAGDPSFTSVYCNIYLIWYFTFTALHCSPRNGPTGFFHNNMIWYEYGYPCDCLIRVPWLWFC